MDGWMSLAESRDLFKADKCQHQSFQCVRVRKKKTQLCSQTVTGLDTSVSVLGFVSQRAAYLL